MSMKNFTKARKFLLKNYAEIEARTGNKSSSISIPMHYIGVLNRKEGNYIESIKYLEKSLFLREKYYSLEHIDTISTLSELGITNYMLGKKDRAKKNLNIVFCNQKKLSSNKTNDLLSYLQKEGIEHSIILEIQKNCPKD